jgi:hypothetical protein
MTISGAIVLRSGQTGYYYYIGGQSVREENIRFINNYMNWEFIVSERISQLMYYLKWNSIYGSKGDNPYKLGTANQIF